MADAVLDRFMSKVVWNGDEDECWTWEGAKRIDGYGGFHLRRRADGSKIVVQAHRFAYEEFVGPIPDDLEIDHLCSNPACVNPDHLEPVTHVENLRRGRNAEREKTHCKHGHPFAGENLRIDKRGRRICIICARKQSRESSSRYYARKRKK